MFLICFLQTCQKQFFSPLESSAKTLVLGDNTAS